MKSRQLKYELQTERRSFDKREARDQSPSFAKLTHDYAQGKVSFDKLAQAQTLISAFADVSSEATQSNLTLVNFRKRKGYSATRFMKWRNRRRLRS